AGVLAALTRAQGALRALPLAAEYLRSHEGLPWIAGRGGRLPGPGLISSALPVAGSVAVTLYDRVVVGEQRSALEVLAPWGYQLVPPWAALSVTLEQIRAR